MSRPPNRQERLATEVSKMFADRLHGKVERIVAEHKNDNVTLSMYRLQPISLGELDAVTRLMEQNGIDIRYAILLYKPAHPQLEICFSALSPSSSSSVKPGSSQSEHKTTKRKRTHIYSPLCSCERCQVDFVTHGIRSRFPLTGIEKQTRSRIYKLLADIELMQGPQTPQDATACCYPAERFIQLQQFRTLSLTSMQAIRATHADLIGDVVFHLEMAKNASIQLCWESGK